MNFLALETSCDETAAAVFTDELAVLSSVVASQTDLHARFGGVVPEIASRAHLRNLLPVIDEALTAGRHHARRTSAASRSTTRRDSSGRCWSASRRRRCSRWGSVCRSSRSTTSQSHIFACRMAAGRDIFPCVGLVVSGGHTALFRCDTALSHDAARRHARRRGRRGIRQGRGDPRARLPRRPGGRTRSGRRRPEGVPLPARVHRRRPARIQLQRAEDGGAVRLPRPGREPGDAAAGRAEARRPRRELPGRGRRRARRQVQAGAAEDGPEAARGRRRRVGEQGAAGGAGGDVREGRSGTVHPAAEPLHRQCGDGGTGRREVEAAASSRRRTWMRSRTGFESGERYAASGD